MKIDFLEVKGTWRQVADACRTTVGKEAGTGEVSSSFKRRLLLAEHSPIRKLSYNWKWADLKSWISVHFVRHKFGIEHWVQSQRPDRPSSTANRDEAPQGTLINHECEANAQAIINISRKRLCQQAMPETREAWREVVRRIEQVEPELARVCVPDCVYRGWCYEMNSCGYHKTKGFAEAVDRYRREINGWSE